MVCWVFFTIENDVKSSQTKQWKKRTKPGGFLAKLRQSVTSLGHLNGTNDRSLGGVFNYLFILDLFKVIFSFVRWLNDHLSPPFWAKNSWHFSQASNMEIQVMLSFRPGA